MSTEGVFAVDFDRCHVWFWCKAAACGVIVELQLSSVRSCRCVAASRVSVCHRCTTRQFCLELQRALFEEWLRVPASPRAAAAPPPPAAAAAAAALDRGPPRLPRRRPPANTTITIWYASCGVQCMSVVFGLVFAIVIAQGRLSARREAARALCRGVRTGITKTLCPNTHSARTVRYRTCIFATPCSTGLYCTVQHCEVFLYCKYSTCERKRKLFAMYCHS